MTGRRAKIEGELKALVRAGYQMLAEFLEKRTPAALSGYQTWYTRALAVVRELLTDRSDEFVRLYRADRKSEKDISALSYGIDDFLLGARAQVRERSSHELKDAFDHETAVFSKLQQQVTILESAHARLNDVLANLRGVLQAELFDTELDTARELLRTGHLRAAGAVAGVVLERHLSSVAAAHNVKVRKKAPTISDWNEALKAADVVDIPVWRNVQRLSDLRNVCCHDKKREPSADEVRELIDGTDKVAKTLA